jgi:ankyrin repeat protein
LEALLKFGADIHSKDRDGRTAPHIASKEGHEQIVMLFWNMAVILIL